MNSLTGTGALVRLALRRDRVTLPIWLAALTLVTAASAASVKSLYATAASRLEFAASVGGNPALAALYGPSYDLGTLGGLATWKLGTSGAILIALMSIFTVTRHTRGDEEPGRLELLGAGVVGRRAALTAGVLVALGANLLLAPLLGLALVGGGVSAGGAFGFGFALAATGGVFTGVAALTAQLTESSRSANAIAVATLGVAYLLRAVGDSGSGTLSWASPLGWTLGIRSFAAEPRWWVYGLSVVATAGLLAASYLLVTRRDVGAGLLPARPGRATAGRTLGSPLGLAWRLQRSSFLGWAVGFTVGGAALGSVASSVRGLVGDNSRAAEMFAELGGAHGLIDSYLAVTMSFLGLLAAGYAVQAVLRLHTEEAGQRAEPLLATRVGRTGWAASHLSIAVLGTVLLLALAGAAAGLAHGLHTHDLSGQLPRLLGAALVQVPAALLVAGIAVALFGLLPRLTALTWAALAGFLLLGELGGLLRLDRWVMDLSPFTHTPKLPGGTFTATPLVWLLAVAVLLSAVGLVGFRRRDLG